MKESQVIAIEQHIRYAIRDAVSRSSRKPLTWGGLAGYDQLKAIAQAIHELPSAIPSKVVGHVVY